MAHRLRRLKSKLPLAQELTAKANSCSLCLIGARLRHNLLWLMFFLGRLSFLGSQNRVQRVSFLSRPEFYDALFANVLDQPLQNSPSQARARHFTATEEDRRLDLVTFFQKAQYVIFFGLVVVIIHVDAEFHFFDRNRLLVLFGLALLLLLLVQE